MGLRPITRITVLRNQRKLGKSESVVSVEKLCCSRVMFRKGNQSHLSSNNYSLCYASSCIWQVEPKLRLFCTAEKKLKLTFSLAKRTGVERELFNWALTDLHIQTLILLSLETHTPNRPLLPHWLPVHLLTINIWVFYLGWFLQAVYSKATNTCDCNEAQRCLLGAGHAERGCGLRRRIAPRGAIGDTLLLEGRKPPGALRCTEECTCY